MIHSAVIASGVEMKHQHIMNACFVNCPNGTRADGDAFFIDNDDYFEKEETVCTGISESFFKDQKLWVMSDFHGPFIISSFYDATNNSNLKALASVLASAFVDDRV